jgi:hypothetical protein
VSVPGHDGTRAAGPLVIALVGDFDGRDELTDPQHQVTLATIAAVQARFRLPPESLRLHAELTPQCTCPGRSIGGDELRTALVEHQRAAASLFAPARPSSASRPLFHDDFLETHWRIDELTRLVSDARSRPRGNAAGTEPPACGHALGPYTAVGNGHVARGAEVHALPEQSTETP